MQHKQIEQRLLHVIGIELPKKMIFLQDHKILQIYIKQLLDFVRQTVQEVRHEDDREVTLIVMQEYAFTPYSISTALREQIHEQLRNIIKESPYQIYLISGSFHHYQKKKTDQYLDQIKFSKEYFKKFSPAYFNQIESIEVKEYFFSLENTVDIISKDVCFQRNKNAAFNEIDRYSEGIEFDEIADNTIVFLGDGEDAVFKFTLKDGTTFTLGVLVCIECDELSNKAYDTVVKKRPDILVIPSASIDFCPPPGIESIVIQADSNIGFTIRRNPAENRLFCAVPEVKKFIYSINFHTVDEQQRSYLWRAAEQGMERSVRYFASIGLDINQVDANGVLPIQIASINGNEGVVKCLMDMNSSLQHSSMNRSHKRKLEEEISGQSKKCKLSNSKSKNMSLVSGTLFCNEKLEKQNKVIPVYGIRGETPKMTNMN